MKHFLKIAAIAPVIFMAACSKNTPSLGLNSDLKLSNITVSGYSAPAGSTILAIGHFTFVKDNPTQASDTSYLVDSFYVPVANGYDQNLNFSTPTGTKNMFFKMNFILDYGAAAGISIDNVKIDYNKKTVLNSGQLNGTTIDNQIFTMPTQQITL